MTWKAIGFLAALILATTIAAIAWGETARWAAIAAVASLTYAVYRWRLALWRRRIDAFRDLEEEQLANALRSRSADEQAAARICLGRSSVNPALAAPAGGDTFRYPRTPMVARELTFWLSAILSALSALALITGSVDHGEEIYAIALAIGFGFSVAVQPGEWDKELAIFVLTPSGIQHLQANGCRSGIQWSHVVSVRNQRWRTCVRFASVDGTVILVRYNLIGFARFMELVVSHLKVLGIRAA